MTTSVTHSIPTLLGGFFTRLRTEMNASPHTIDSYRYAMRLLLEYATDKLGKAHTDLLVEDLDADLVAAFLLYLEEERNNSTQTRNIRLAAIRKVFEYIGSREPELMLTCQKVLTIPAKRTSQRMVDYLDPEETSALLSAPDLSTWIGRRDRCLLLVALQTGLRVSELVGLDLGYVSMTKVTDASLHVLGKGRKERTVPLREDSVEVLTTLVAGTVQGVAGYNYPTWDCSSTTLLEQHAIP